MLRDSINGAWLLGIIITFMAILIAYITIQINYSKAYEMKTKIVTTVEQYNGLNPLTLERINKIATSYGYTKTSKCRLNAGDKIVGILDGIVTTDPSAPQSFCFNRETMPGDSTTETKYYYSVEVFFGFTVPVLGDIFTFRISGETNAVYYPSSSDYFN
jgi:hypothetical protein